MLGGHPLLFGLGNPVIFVGCEDFKHFIVSILLRTFLHPRVDLLERILIFRVEDKYDCVGTLHMMPAKLPVLLVARNVPQDEVHPVTSSNFNLLSADIGHEA